MNQIEYKKSFFTLDVMNVNSPKLQVGTFKEFDNVKFTIKLVNNERPVSLEGKLVKLFAKLPDNSPMYQEEDVVIVNETRGLVDIIVRKMALSQIGEVQCELEVFNSDLSMLTSGEFSFTVNDKANNFDVSGEDLGDPINVLREIAEFSLIIKPQEEARVAAEGQRDASERVRMSSEATRMENELDRIERMNVIEEKVNTVISNTEIDTIISNALA